VKTSKTPSVWFEVFTGSGQNVNPADTATVSEAYAKMLTIFIPLLVDEVKVLSIVPSFKLVNISYFRRVNINALCFRAPFLHTSCALKFLQPLMVIKLNTMRIMMIVLHLVMSHSQEVSFLFFLNYYDVINCSIILTFILPYR